MNPLSLRGDRNSRLILIIVQGCIMHLNDAYSIFVLLYWSSDWRHEAYGPPCTKRFPFAVTGSLVRPSALFLFSSASTLASAASAIAVEINRIVNDRAQGRVPSKISPGVCDHVNRGTVGHIQGCLAHHEHSCLTACFRAGRSERFFL